MFVYCQHQDLWGRVPRRTVQGSSLRLLLVWPHVERHNHPKFNKHSYGRSLFFYICHLSMGQFFIAMSLWGNSCLGISLIEDDSRLLRKLSLCFKSSAGGSSFFWTMLGQCWRLQPRAQLLGSWSQRINIPRKWWKKRKHKYNTARQICIGIHCQSLALICADNSVIS